MVKSELVAYLNGSEMQDGDEIVVKTADGTSHAISSVIRTGEIQTTLPAGVDVQPPVITLQLA